MESHSHHNKKTVGKDIWFVFISVSVVTMLDFGIIFAFGALFVDMMETFESDRASTATVQSLLIGISLGFRAGISMIHVMSIVFIQHNFPTNLQPICFAIHGTGVNIAGMIYPLLIEKLLDKYTVRGTFLILGGVFMNSLVVPVLLLNNDNFRNGMEGKNKQLKDLNKKLTHDNGASTEMVVLIQEPKHNSVKSDDTLDEAQTQSENTCNHSDLEIRKTLKYPSIIECQFLLLLLASASCIPALNSYLGLIVDIFIWKGFSVSQGQVSFVPFNVFSILSKFIPVLAKSYMKSLSCFVMPLCFCVIGLISQVLVYVSNNYIVLMIGTSCVGLSLGGVFPAMLIAGAKIVPRREWPVVSGLLMSVIGIMSSGLGPLFGFGRDKSGTYTYVIFTIGILQTVGIMLFMCALITRKRINRSRRMSE
ncbi:uncharacterized protein LOC132713396 isoform X2 [Ruditapes philippinarum]|uniref:uncharacterized protein LOC132713396 isoform X2 n=1 Tax=Ruditapes philippinarum TaxID=129788 RepID=UPI00295C0106|nr:uncharacterized protein LOC132713396 isoform X2 [Ruditapes philippinarum]